MPAAHAEESAPQAVRVMKASFEGGQAAVGALKASRVAPPPPKMTGAEKIEYDAYVAWLGTVISRMEGRLAPMKASLDKGGTRDAAKLHADFAATMDIVREEAAKQHLLSTIMKSKHDTVKNSISNVR